VNARTDRILLAVAAALALGAAGDAHATNGYFTHGVGAKSKSMAGAGTVDPQETIGLATNPATLIGIPERLEVGLAVFSPRRKYETSESLANGQGGAFTIGPNSIDSDKEFFPIPYIAKNWTIGEQDALGVAFFGRGGMNTTWKGGTATFDPDGPGPAPVDTFPGTYGAGQAGVDLMQAFLTLAYAHQNEAQTLSYGVGVTFAAQRFEAKGVSSFAGYTRTFAASFDTGSFQFNAFPENLSDNGYDMSYGAGASFGIKWTPMPRFDLGLAYTTETLMSKLDKYSDLFAEGGGFDIPAALNLGLAFRATDRVTLYLDGQHIWFSDVKSVGNPIQNLFNCPTAGQGGTDLESCLGGKRGGGFGWNDVTVVKVGVSWELNDTWTLRAGFGHTEQPIDSDQMTFNILAPAVIDDHVSFGFSRRSASGNEWSVSMMYAFDNSQKGPNNFDPTQTVEFSMDQWELEFAYAWGK
jgi:long-chain fatty acid transport protein